MDSESPKAPTDSEEQVNLPSSRADIAYFIQQIKDPIEEGEMVSREDKDVEEYFINEVLIRDGAKRGLEKALDEYVMDKAEDSKCESTDEEYVNSIIKTVCDDVCKNRQDMPNEYQPEKMQLLLKEILKLAKQLKATVLPFWKLVIDPNDLATTFDNAFQVSVLVNQGFLGIQKGHDGDLEITLSTERRRKKYSRSTTTIMASMKFIDEMVEKYNIREPMLPPMHLKAEKETESTSGQYQSSTLKDLGLKYLTETDNDSDDDDDDHDDDESTSGQYQSSTLKDLGLKYLTETDNDSDDDDEDHDGDNDDDHDDD